MLGEGKDEKDAGGGGDLWESSLRLLEAVAKTLGWKAALATALSSVIAGVAAHLARRGFVFVVGATCVIFVISVGAVVYARARLRKLKEEVGVVHHQISHQLRDSIHEFIASLQSNADLDPMSRGGRHRQKERLIEICNETKHLFEVLTRSDKIGVSLFLTDRISSQGESDRGVPVAALAYSTRTDLRATEESTGERHMPIRHSLEVGQNLPFQHAVNGETTAQVSFFCTDDSRKCSCHCDVEAFRKISISLLICPVSCKRTKDVVGFIWLDSSDVGVFAREHHTHAAAIADQLYTYVMLTRSRLSARPTSSNAPGAITARSIKPRARDAG